MMGDKVACVYKIRCRANGRFYIGSTANLSKRRREHLWRLRRGNHHCTPLQNAWNKYGPKAFVFSIVLRCEEDQLEVSEQNALDGSPKKELFNCCPTAGSLRGFNHSSETREKMRQAALVHGAKQKIRERRAEVGRQRAEAGTLNVGRKGVKLPDATKRKMKEAAKRVGADPEERRRRSERAKRQWAAGNIGRKNYS